MSTRPVDNQTVLTSRPLGGKKTVRFTIIPSSFSEFEKPTLIRYVSLLLTAIVQLSLLINGSLYHDC